MISRLPKGFTSLVQVLLIFIISWSFLHAQERSGTDGKSCLWEVSSGKNKIYLLGSIHLLKKAHYPLNEAIEAAFDDVEILMFEIDLDKIETEKNRQMILSKGTFSNGKTLERSLKEETYNLAKKKVKEAGLDIHQLNHFEPWFFSVTLIAIRLQQLGFDPDYGIDKYFFNKAKQGGKRIAALETVEYHIRLFDELSKADQEKFVLQTLRDFDAFDNEMNKVVWAWASGDLKKLEELLLKSFREFPRIYDKLIIERNKNWLPKIDALLREKQKYLVIVGSGHLLGKKGLVELLKERGYTIRQL